MPEKMDSLARKGANYVLFMKLSAIVTGVFLTMIARGIKPGIVVIILIIPLWLLAEKLMANTGSRTFWKRIEEREEFSRLPLSSDVDKMKGARKGQKAKQAILEGRLKDQVIYTLKDEYNLSGEELKDLEKDPTSMMERIDNEDLIKYLKNARDLNELKKPNGKDQVDLFSDEEDSEEHKELDEEDLEFENKIRSAIGELEDIHYVEEDR